MSPVRRTFVAAAVIVLLTGALARTHHSFAGSGFDGSRAVHLEGTIVEIEWVNPHSWITLAVAGPNGRTDRWALEGPSLTQLQRRNVDLAAFRAGTVLRACGYARADEPERSATIPSGRRSLSAELLTLADGRTLIWSNYGQGKCLDGQS